MLQHLATTCFCQNVANTQKPNTFYQTFFYTFLFSETEIETPKYALTQQIITLNKGLSYLKKAKTQSD
jgi:hypothetical protein